MTFTPPATPPRCETQLRAAARRLTGLSLKRIADRLGRPTPPNLRRHKGWVGDLIEAALGARAPSAADPDFLAAGVELKTIPIHPGHGRPRETTWVCTVRLGQGPALPWEHSPVRDKLRRVLWVPIESHADLPLAERRVGRPLLWSPSPAQEDTLAADWEEITEIVSQGRVDELNASLGEYLHVRPKARHGGIRKLGVGPDGGMVETLPRGFYLRTQLTSEILAQQRVLP